ncbi:uncharacterized protein LOC123559110 [Mercenaria mercenaria]|uniref:uncharacterized protein LOC123559110 n=1 Tax=Mercenaria mercenaria TaxID=6596 RepID=UPI00234E4A41|nr:uncharacterized protein LOC123559110 [Mercenaria mercenaria]
MLRCIFNILIIILGTGSCSGFDIFHFHDYCGKTITNYAGELRFDAEKLPSYLPGGKCSVSIMLQKALFHSKTYALFYFTKFDLSSFCKITNVSIVDGIPESGAHIKGLPPFICGHNKTLENTDSVFKTRSDKLTVTLKRSNNARLFYGKFSMKYVQFSLGTCNGQGVYKCSTGWCIPNVYRCSSDINACGEKQTGCNDEGEVAVSFSDKVLNILENVLWIGGAVFGICTFRFFYRKYRKRSSPAQLSLYGGPANENRRSSFRAHAVQANPLPTEQMPLSTVEEQHDIMQLCTAGTLTDINTYDSSNCRNSFHETRNSDSDIDCNNISSRDADLTSLEYNTTSCLDPPPSYEDVMAQPQNYK